MFPSNGRSESRMDVPPDDFYNMESTDEFVDRKTRTSVLTELENSEVPRTVESLRLEKLEMFKRRHLQEELALLEEEEKEMESQELKELEENIMRQEEEILRHAAELLPKTPGEPSIPDTKKVVVPVIKGQPPVIKPGPSRPATANRLRDRFKAEQAATREDTKFSVLPNCPKARPPKAYGLRNNIPNANSPKGVWKVKEYAEAKEDIKQMTQRPVVPPRPESRLGAHGVQREASPRTRANGQKDVLPRKNVAQPPTANRFGRFNANQDDKHVQTQKPKENLVARLPRSACQPGGSPGASRDGKAASSIASQKPTCKPSLVPQPPKIGRPPTANRFRSPGVRRDQELINKVQQWKIKDPRPTKKAQPATATATNSPSKNAKISHPIEAEAGPAGKETERFVPQPPKSAKQATVNRFRRNVNTRSEISDAAKDSKVGVMIPKPPEGPKPIRSRSRTGRARTPAPVTPDHDVTKAEQADAGSHHLTCTTEERIIIDDIDLKCATGAAPRIASALDGCDGGGEADYSYSNESFESSSDDEGSVSSSRDSASPTLMSTTHLSPRSKLLSGRASSFTSNISSARSSWSSVRSESLSIERLKSASRVQLVIGSVDSADKCIESDAVMAASDVVEKPEATVARPGVDVSTPEERASDKQGTKVASPHIAKQDQVDNIKYDNVDDLLRSLAKDDDCDTESEWSRNSSPLVPPRMPKTTKEDIKYTTRFIPYDVATLTGRKSPLQPSHVRKIKLSKLPPKWQRIEDLVHSRLPEEEEDRSVQPLRVSRPVSPDEQTRQDLANAALDRVKSRLTGDAPLQRDPNNNWGNRHESRHAEYDDDGERVNFRYFLRSPCNLTDEERRRKWTPVSFDHPELKSIRPLPFPDYELIQDKEEESVPFEEEEPFEPPEPGVYMVDGKPKWYWSISENQPKERRPKLNTLPPAVTALPSVEKENEPTGEEKAKNRDYIQKQFPVRFLS